MIRENVTVEEAARRLREKYELPEEETKAHLASGWRYMDLDKAAALAWIKGCPLGEVLRLQKDLPWGRVKMALGLTAEAMADGECRLRAWQLARWWGYDEARSLAMLRAGFPMHWVKVAWLLAEHGPFSMEDILRRRSRAVPWWDWAAAAWGADPEEVKRWIKERRNPGLPLKK